MSITKDEGKRVHKQLIFSAPLLRIACKDFPKIFLFFPVFFWVPFFFEVAQVEWKIETSGSLFSPLPLSLNKIYRPPPTEVKWIPGHLKSQFSSLSRQKKEEKGLRVCYPLTSLASRRVHQSSREANIVVRMRDREKTLREWSQKGRRLSPASQQDSFFFEYATKMTEKRKPTSLTSSPTTQLFLTFFWSNGVKWPPPPHFKGTMAHWKGEQGDKNLTPTKSDWLTFFSLAKKKDPTVAKKEVGVFFVPFSSLCRILPHRRPHCLGGCFRRRRRTRPAPAPSSQLTFSLVRRKENNKENLQTSPSSIYIVKQVRKEEAEGFDK